MSASTHNAQRRLGLQIQRHRADIEKRWLARVREGLVPERRGIDPTQLRDGLGDYIERLAEILIDAAPANHQGRDAWRAVAREHALTRVQLGFDIGQLVREFVLLRRIILDVAAEEGVLETHSALRLVDLVEGAIAEAVQSYVDSRDFRARRDEATHISFITHELRNPLATAVFATRQLSSQLKLDAAQARAMSLIMHAQEKLRVLIDAVLAVGRFEAGEVETHPVDVVLADVVEGGVTAARAVAHNKGLDFQLKVDPAIHVEADPQLLTSAIENLIDNAVKYTDDGAVKLTVEQRNEDIAVHIWDSCHGITEEDLRTIFQPFKRGHTSKPGTGMGLAIARRAVEAQGGQIHAESVPGHSCHFWFTLPKRAA